MFREKLAAIFAECIEEVCDDITRADGIYADAVLDGFEGQRARELREGPLGRCVSGDTREGLIAGIGAGIDNRTAFCAGSWP